MLLDAIIGLLFALFELSVIAIEVLGYAIELLICLVAGIFGRTPKLKPIRLARGNSDLEERVLSSRKVVGFVVLLILGLVCYFGYNGILYRNVSVVARDGLPVPLGKFIVETKNANRERLTRFNGELRLPRFGWQ